MDRISQALYIIKRKSAMEIEKMSVITPKIIHHSR